MMKLENVRDVTSDALPNIWLTPLIGIIIMGSFCFNFIYDNDEVYATIC